MKNVRVGLTVAQISEAGGDRSCYQSLFSDTIQILQQDLVEGSGLPLDRILAQIPDSKDDHLPVIVEALVAQLNTYAEQINTEVDDDLAAQELLIQQGSVDEAVDDAASVQATVPDDVFNLIASEQLKQALINERA